MTGQLIDKWITEMKKKLLFKLIITKAK